MMKLRLGICSLFLFTVSTVAAPTNCPDWNCEKTCFVFKERKGCPICECKLNFESVDDMKVDPGFREFMNEVFRTDAYYDSLNSDVQQAGTTSYIQKWDNLQARNGRWIIPYIIDSSITDTAMIGLIQSSIADMENFACFTFVERTDQTSYILFQDDTTLSCWSYVGRRYNNAINYIQLRQLVSPGSSSCQIKGIVLHEIMHALGFFHEHQRADRDDYVTIKESNMQSGKSGNFLKLKVSQWEGFNSPYDFGSIMQYHPKSFSKNNRAVIVANNGESIAEQYQRSKLADSDIFQIRAMYNCDAVTTQPATTAEATTTAATTAASTGCIDKTGISNCNKHKDKGKCFTNANTMKKNCDFTCNFCGCADILGDCATRKSNGECYSDKTSAKFMKTNCPVTCGFCGDACLDAPGFKCRKLSKNKGCRRTKKYAFMATNCRSKCKHCIKV